MCAYSYGVMFIDVLWYSLGFTAKFVEYQYAVIYVEHSLVLVFNVCSLLGSLHHNSLVISQLVVLCDT